MRRTLQGFSNSYKTTYFQKKHLVVLVVLVASVCFLTLPSRVCERKLVKGEKQKQRPAGLDICAFTRDSERVKVCPSSPSTNLLLSSSLSGAAAPKRRQAAALVLSLAATPSNLWLTFDRAAFMRCCVVPVYPEPENAESGGCRGHNQFSCSTTPLCLQPAAAGVFIALRHAASNGQRGDENIPTVILKVEHNTYFLEEGEEKEEEEGLLFIFLPGFRFDDLFHSLKSLKHGALLALCLRSSASLDLLNNLFEKSKGAGPKTVTCDIPKGV